MRNIQMAKGAHTVVNRCARVKPGETVLIVTEPSRMSIAEELGAAVCAAGGEPVFCSILPRWINDCSSYRSRMFIFISRIGMMPTRQTIRKMRSLRLFSRRTTPVF